MSDSNKVNTDQKHLTTDSTKVKTDQEHLTTDSTKVNTNQQHLTSDSTKVNTHQELLTTDSTKVKTDQMDSTKVNNDQELLTTDSTKINTCTGQEHLTKDSTKVSYANVSLPRVTEKSDLLMKIENDQHACYIVGISITPEGVVLFADLNNRKLKAFSHANAYLSSVKIPHGPLNVAVVDHTKALVSANNMKIHVMDISNIEAIAIAGTINLDFKVLGVAPCNRHIVVTAMTNPRSVKMIDWNGNVIWSRAADNNRAPLFKAPDYIATFGPENQNVVVSDYRSVVLTYLNGDDGQVQARLDSLPEIGTRKAKFFSQPGVASRDLTFDKFNNLFITYPERNEICVISEDLEHGDVLVGVQNWFASLSSVLGFNQKRPVDCREQPSVVACNTTTDELYVSYFYCSNFVDHFKLSYDDLWERINVPELDKTNKIACTSSKDSDQPAHLRILIKIFAVPARRSLGSLAIHRTPIELWLDYGFAGWSESSRDAHVIL